MKNRLVVAASLSLVAMASASAQTSCPAGIPTAGTASSNTQQQAADLFQYMAPQLATSLAGGNATLGQSGTLGGLGHFSIGVRATGMNGDLPDVANFPRCYTGSVKSNLPTKSQLLGVPAADAEIGIFKGIPLGLTSVGGVDLIVSASYVPELDLDAVKLNLPDGSLKIGYGARIGVIQESLVMPGVSITYLKRDLPTADISAATSSGDTLSVTGLKLKTSAWRVVAGKSFLIFGVQAGAGQDKYESSVAQIRGSVNAGAPVGRASGSLSNQVQNLTRTNYFANLSLNLPLFKLVGEVGQASGGTVNTFNTFAGNAADASRTYFSAGLRFGF